MPAWQRDVPLLYSGDRLSGDRLLYVPRLGVNRDIDAQGDGAWRRIEWRPDLLIA